MSRKKFFITGIVCLSLINIQCKNESEKATIINPDPLMTTIQKEQFGTTPEGVQIELYTLSNSNGMMVEIITYGGRIVSWTAPDHAGKFENVVLGLDSQEQYQKENPYFGALIGRFANRIAGGEFYLDGIKYTLPVNNGENHLHGGDQGFDKVVWEAEVDEDSNSLRLTYLSKDMEQGYPGNLNVMVTYTLKDDNSLEVEYEATTDKKTVVNLTQHSYFNLSGNFNNTILDHEVTINADHFLPVDGSLIPTGEIKEVQRTFFDFREPKLVGENINKVLEEQQLERAGGYDHNFVLNNPNEGIRFAASAYHPESRRLLEVFTDMPGIQLYTGNFLDGTLPIPGKNANYEKRTGFCLETQRFPDAPNQENFPETTLEPGETFTSKTIFKFSVKTGK